MVPHDSLAETFSASGAVRIAFLLVSLLRSPAAAKSTHRDGQKFNVMYFVADDLRPEIGPYGQTNLITPNLDRLAAGGLTFENAYCQQAVCGPSRASFMTGRRPAHTNVYDNNANFREIGRDSNGPGSSWITMPEHFKGQGFLTLGGGKTFHPNHPKNWDLPTSWSSDLPYFPFSYYINPNATYGGQPCLGHSGPPVTPPGTPSCSKIDTWCVIDEEDSHFYDDTLANNTVERLKFAAAKFKAGQPFFMMSGFARPHAPWRVPKRIWDMYEDVEIPLAKHRYPIDGMPGVAWYQGGFYNALDGTLHVPDIDKPIDNMTAYSMRRAYYSAVTWMDEQLGKCLDALSNLELEDSTIVLIHGDHGWQLGEHNSWHKFTNFELGVRVPLIIKHPAMSSSVGQKTKIFAELIDMYPTLADLSNSGSPKDILDGVSLASVFEDPSISSIPTEKGTLNKSVAYSQFPHHSDFGCPIYHQSGCTNASLTISGEPTWMGYSVRNHIWRYTVWVPGPDYINNWPSNSTMFELYNHSTDNGTNFDTMDEPRNLAYDTDYESARESMHKIAYNFFHDFLPPQPSPSPSPPSPSDDCSTYDGIADKDNSVCCDESCGKCGGKACGTEPGGNAGCCEKHILSSGEYCKTTSHAPCILSNHQYDFVTQ